jgi:hypothetical protein
MGQYLCQNKQNAKERENRNHDQLTLSRACLRIRKKNLMEIACNKV